MDIVLCSCNNAVGHAKNIMPSRKNIDLVAEIFKMCGDPTRVGILCALCGHKLCVCELASVLDMSSSAISHQLRLMKHSGLIESHRCGKSVEYSIANSNIEEIFRLALRYAGEGKE